VINNASDARALKVDLSSLSVAGPVTGEESREHVRWRAIEPFQPESSSRIRTAVPARSITTFAVGLDRRKN
jgi:hypothetical protein